MPTRFLEFPKLHTRLPELSVADHRRLSRVQWTATEKVHGANFSISTDGSEVRYAKRTYFLPPEEDFFGYRRLAADLETSTEQLWDALSAPGVRQVTVYGELCGGSYPHPDVPPVPGARPVQAGPWYSPDICFLVFDVVVVSWPQRRFLDSSELAATSAAGFTPVPRVATGSLEELQELSLERDTLVPDLLGLPPLPDPSARRAEGLVLRADTSVDLPSGPWRPILKRKHPAFDEARFPAAQRPLSPLQQVQAASTRLLLDSAISKVGRDHLPEALDLAVAEALVVLPSDVLAGLTAGARARLESAARARLVSLLDRRERRSLPR